MMSNQIIRLHANKIMLHYNTKYYVTFHVNKHKIKLALTKNIYTPLSERYSQSRVFDKTTK